MIPLDDATCREHPSPPRATVLDRQESISEIADPVLSLKSMALWRLGEGFFAGQGSGVVGGGKKSIKILFCMIL